MDTLNNQRVEFWGRWHGDQSSNLFKDTIACLNGLLARRSFKNPRSFWLSSSTIVCIWDSSQTIWFIQWFIGIYNNHYKDAYYGWDDHQPYSEYWPWLIWQLWIVIPFRWSIDGTNSHRLSWRPRGFCFPGLSDQLGLVARQGQRDRNLVSKWS